MITAKLRRLRQVTGYAWHRFKMRHTHWRVERRDGSAGFCAYGEERAVVHFARYYLGSADDVVVRRGWHRGDFTAHMRAMTRRYGLAVASDQEVPAGVAAEALAWPWLVAMTITLPATMAEYRRGLNDSAQADVKRIIKQGFRCEVSRDAAKAKEFYHRYYLPSMTSRHGADAYLFGEEDMLALLMEGAFLLEVWRGEEWVSAVLCRHAAEGVAMLRLGWRNGDEDVYRQGAVAALYWLTVAWSVEHGARRLFLGGAAPYLEDGLLVFKSKWGARLDFDASDFNVWRVLTEPAHPVCRAFLATHSVVFKNEAAKRFEVLSGLAREEVNGAEQHAQIAEWRRVN